MIPRAREFEKAVRRQARELLRADKASWKEYRLRRRVQPAHAGTWMGSLLGGIFILFAVGARAQQPDGAALAILILTLFATGSSFWRAATLLQNLCYSHDVRVFAHLPMSDAEFLRGQLLRALRFSLFSSLPLSFLCYLAVAGQTHVPGGALRGALLSVVLLAVAQWLTVVAGAVILAGYRPSWQNGWVGLALVLVAFLGAIFPSMLRNVTALPWPVLLVFPAGWPAAAFRVAVLEKHTEMLWLAAPPLLLFLFVPGALRRLRKFYVLKEVSVSAQGQTTTILAVDPRTLQPADPREAARHYDLVRERSGAVQTEDLWGAEKDVLSGRFLEPLDWRKLPVLERMIAATLTVRERTVLEFVCRDQPGWSGSYRGIVIAMAIVVALVRFTPQLAAVAALFVAMYVVFSGSIVPTTAAFPGLKPLPCSGNFVPLYALYPVTFAQLSRTLVTVTMMRTLALLPCVVLFGAGLAWVCHFPPVRGAEIATKVIAVVLAAQPGLVGFLLFRGTNYSELIMLRSLPWQCSVLLWGASLLGAGAVMLLYSGMIVAVMAIAAALVSGLFWLWCRYVYDNGRADLVRTTAE